MLTHHFTCTCPPPPPPPPHLTHTQGRIPASTSFLFHKNTTLLACPPPPHTHRQITTPMTDHSMDHNPAYDTTKNVYEYDLSLQTTSFVPALPPPRGNTVPRDFRHPSPYMNMDPAPIAIRMNFPGDDGNYEKIEDILPQVTVHNPLYDRPDNMTGTR